MKKSMEDFIRFLETADIQSVTGDDLREFLDKNYPEWRAIVRTPESWPLLEKLVKERQEFIGVMLQAGGGGLVSRWFDSRNKNIRDATMIWLQDLSWGEVDEVEISPELWCEFSDEVKDYIVEHLFNTDTPEFHEFYRMLFRIVEEECVRLQEMAEEKESLAPINIVLPPVGYVQGPYIRRLATTIEKAGDRKFSARLRSLIEERKEAYNQSLLLMKGAGSLYTPIGLEKELISTLLRKLKSYGFVLSKLPPVYTSMETPPLLLCLSENEHDGSAPLRERLFEIDELLGRYDVEPSITLYIKGIEWFSKKEGLKRADLKAVVLLYEMCNWVIQRLEKSDLPQWHIEHYVQTPRSVRETLAYVLTELVVEESGSWAKTTFDKLKTFLPLLPPAIDGMDRLVKKIWLLRRLGRPANIHDLVEGS